MKKLVQILSILSIVNFNLLFSAASSSGEIVTSEIDDYCSVDFQPGLEVMSKNDHYQEHIKKLEADYFFKDFKPHDEKVYRELGLYENQDYKDTVKILFDACKNGYVGVVDAILQSKKVDVNIKYENKFNPEYKDIIKGSTLLMLAAYHGQKDIVELLMSYKANINIKDSLGYTVLGSPFYQIDSPKKRDEIIELIITRCYHTEQLIEVLFDRCESGYVEIVNSILKSGKIDINVKDPVIGRTILTTFIGFDFYGCRTDFVNMLIKNGARIDDKDGKGMTPLMRAAADGNRKYIELLINKGANLNIKSDWGDTALQIAFRQIFECERNINDNNSINTFYKNEVKRYRDIVEILKKNGAT